MSQNLPPPPLGKCYLPNGDLTTHNLRWSGMVGSEWCRCISCGYVPEWSMTSAPSKSAATDSDLKCPWAREIEGRRK